MLSELFDSTNTWVIDHKELMTVVAVPTLVWIVTSLVNRSAEKRAAEERRVERTLARELKLSDYRLKWIEDLREELAIYTALHWSRDIQEMEGSAKQGLIVQARILMRVSPNHPDYDDLQEKLSSPVADVGAGRDALYVVGERILSREWKSLQNDLEATEQTQ